MKYKYKYRNNLVRATLSVFAACTLLYIASASAQSSTQLNSLALTPKFSDALVATSLGPLLSEDITRDESYTSEAMTQGTATHEAPTMILAQMESAQQPQLATPVIDGVFSSSSLNLNKINVTWSSRSLPGGDNVEKYKLNLYLGNGTNGLPEQTGERINDSINLSFSFLSVRPVTEYTVELIAQATGFRDSDPDTETITTEKQQLSAPEVTAAFVARRSNGLTFHNIRVAWGSVENAQSYTVNLLTRSNSDGTTSPLKAQVVDALTVAVFENVLNNQFYTVGVTAMSDIYPNSELSFVNVRPSKLSSEFFTVTPSVDSLSLAWDPSFDASLEDGVYFYDATRIDNLGDSARSILRISIEDISGGEIVVPMEVSTEENSYSTDGLEETTNYVLKIAQRVTIGDDSLDSQALEIPFRTLEELPEPTENQIRWAADETTLTVEWDDVPAGVSSYDLTLTRTDGLTDTVVEG
ncbi:MAG: hypothetical protein ACNYNY_05275, partial [Candidatus Oxydemutatoraceae bacterium WSBS_2016_MAG_OTU14]